MKTKPSRFSFAALVLVACAGLNFDARAATPYITGTISFTGNASLNGPISTCTAITSFSNITAIADTNGSYAPLGHGSPATWTPFTFNPATVPVIPLWTVSSNGITYSFDATSMIVTFSSSNFLHIQGSGIAHITGYADTPGTWLIDVGQVSSLASINAATMISPTNIPTISCSGPTNGNIAMTWNALLGQPYQLLTATNLGQPVWTNAGGVISTTNATVTTNYSTGSDIHRFFRVLLVP